MNRVMNMARTARAAGDSGICHVMLRGSPTKDIRRRRVMLTENRPLFTSVGTSHSRGNTDAEKKKHLLQSVTTPLGTRTSFQKETGDGFQWH